MTSVPGDDLQQPSRAAAAPLSPSMPAAEPVSITTGADDFAAIAPTVEPLSAGEPPTDPRVVAVAVRRAGRLVRTASGVSRSSALGTDAGRRVSLTLVWEALTGDRCRAVLDWLSGVSPAGTLGGALAMTVYPDGRAGTAKRVRQIGPARAVMQLAVRPDGSDRVGIWSVTVPAEEVA